MVDEGMKFDDGKLDFTLAPVAILESMARAFMHGEKKYARHNYKNLEGGAFRYYKALMRHLTAWQSGENIDIDSGLNHLDLASACLAIVIYFQSVDDIGDWR